MRRHPFSVLVVLALLTLSALQGSGSAAATYSSGSDSDPSARSSTEQAHRPDVVFFLSDDHGRSFGGLYGESAVRTPALDRLAREGMTFERAFTSTAMCTPSRSVLYTGLEPHRNGAARNHGEIDPDVRTLPERLDALGYDTALAGKVHVGPREAFPFEYISVGAVDSFLAAPRDRPFLLVVASDDPHTPHPEGDYRPGDVATPPFLVDTPATRERLARYAADVTRMDSLVGRIRASLETRGRADATVFMYASDHGAPLPYGKWTLYETGLQVPFVVRWPGVVEAGSRAEAMVGFHDVAATLIAIAGGTVPSELDGRSFLPVLRGETDTHREYVFGTHTNEGIHHGGPYPVRSVRSDSFKYIVNLEAHRTFTNNITEGAIFSADAVGEENLQAYYRSGEGYGSLWRSWVERARTDSFAATRTIGYQHRPPEELYDLTEDPHELDNLLAGPSASARARAARDRLRDRLAAWMKAQGDPLAERLAGNSP